GRVTDGIELLRVASRLLPSFDSTADPEVESRAVRLASGPAGRTALVSFPAAVALSGPHQYARLAGVLRGLRDVMVLPHPGFLPGERLPVDLDAVVAAQTRAALRCARGGPVALLGYSSGGWVAHAVAARM